VRVWCVCVLRRFREYTAGSGWVSEGLPPFSFVSFNFFSLVRGGPARRRTRIGQFSRLLGWKRYVIPQLNDGIKRNLKNSNVALLWKVFLNL
jgi:hypothetical protein